MTDEQKRRVIAEARRTLEQTAGIKDAMTERLMSMPRARDEIREWAEWHEQRDAERAAGRAELKRQERAMAKDYQLELEQLIDARVAAAIEREREQTRTLLVECIAKVFTRIDAMAQKLERQLRPLTSDASKVIDLPSPLTRRRAN
jgi:P2-related tail formation protein